MIQPAFNIGNTDTTPLSGNADLLIEVSAQSLNYILYEKDPHALLLLRQYRLYTTGDRSSRDLIDEVIEEDPLIQQHLGNALVVYNFPEANIVPAELYKKEINSSITRLMHGDRNHEFVFGEQIRDLGMHNVYSVPQDIHSLLKEKFKGSRYWHIYTLLLLAPGSLQIEKNNIIKTVFYHDKFIAAFYSSEKLQLIQTFNYQTPEDVAYYLLLICKQFDIPQQQMVLSVSGLIDSQSALYSELVKYFPEVYEEEIPQGIEVNGLLGEFPAHYFSPLLKMSLCGL
ncbi:MAG: DUF3822 family protein [Chitinophagaceae bacterium]|nr:DUF3822 family protein [Chitinophagaceae bacterium]